MSEDTASAFADSMEHLTAELRRLDLLLHREILRLRARYQLSLDEFRGLYVSDEQVDRLVAHMQSGKETGDAQSLTERANSLREHNRRRLSADLPWCRLVEIFQLSQTEQDILLIALAPELDLKYETLYAYLNNDVTRKWPTCELALRILSPWHAAETDFRPDLLPQAKLFEEGILRFTLVLGDRPRWLANGIAVSPTVVSYLLDQRAMDHEIASFVSLRCFNRLWRDVPVRKQTKDLLQNMGRYLNEPAKMAAPPILVFEGRPGCGRRAAAEALARELRCPMLIVDLETARSAGESLGKIAVSIALHQRLYQAMPYIVHGELLFDKEGNRLHEASALIKALDRATKPVVFSSAPSVPWRDLMKGRHLMFVPFSDLSATERFSVWKAATASVGHQVGEPVLRSVADRFVLTPGQIEAAVASGAQRQLVADNDHGDPNNEAVWLEAARVQSDHSLGQLAIKVNTIHTWDDLVLPLLILSQIQQITSAIRFRQVVYEEWGFETRLVLGKGLKLLFSGPSGTGKTMTAGVIAQDLGLDLYKIDLSCVVSKYIGETEKNLDRIFRAAQCSNAILFFDEADALFGKRSEVKDAHDRYANIEVAYLLQKLEEHDGTVILATNLSKNIDEAFARRMHYVVRFPLPDATDRERLWRGMFPAQAPLDDGIDFEFVASQFSFVGGDIKNIVLDTAFRAASDGGVITMSHLLRAISQHLIKQGRAPTVADFRQYYDLLADQA